MPLTKQLTLGLDFGTESVRALFVDLMAESTPDQRERLLKKIEGVRKDFSDLKCLKAAQN